MSCPPPRRFQFSLSRLFAASFACALMFAAFHWLGLSPRTSLFISVLFAACMAAALALLAAIGKSLSQEDDQT
jgi:hypothetical protein